jgi:osmotically-inducible protein OsmY
MNVLRFWILLIIFTLQGCVNAAISGAQVAYNHNSLKSTYSDYNVSLRSSQAIYLYTERYKNTRVSVSCFNQVVLLTGYVSTPQQKNEIESIVKRVSKTKELYNFIDDTHKKPSVLTQMNDSWITTKIKSRFIVTNDIDPDSIKIITENGTVYLMGIVQPLQAKIAVHIASTTSGVRNIVKIFSYLRISKTE